eukprot:scaffold95753_cov70-Phaeocystis_antarctica.AAC.4
MVLVSYVVATVANRHSCSRLGADDGPWLVHMTAMTMARHWAAGCSRAGAVQIVASGEWAHKER